MVTPEVRGHTWCPNPAGARALQSSRTLFQEGGRCFYRLAFVCGRFEHLQLLLPLFPSFSCPPACRRASQISGLLNGDVLKGLAGQGIACSTGDNSWPALFLNPTNVHQMLYTTAAKNGYAGMAILPRFATEVGPGDARAGLTRRSVRSTRALHCLCRCAVLRD
jgi:hypothetical protein